MANLEHYNHLISPVVFSFIVSNHRRLGSVSLAIQLSFLIELAVAVKSKAENIVGLCKGVKMKE